MQYKKLRALSFTELLITMLIVSVLLAVSVPVMSMRSKVAGLHKDSITCLKGEKVQNLNSTSCAQAVRNCTYGINNACSTIIKYADGSDAIDKANAYILLKASCDNGSQEACRYFVKQCLNKNNCNISSGNNGLYYWLNMTMKSASLGGIMSYKLTKPYYNSTEGAFANITSLADSLCCTPNLGIACALKGTYSCAAAVETAWQYRMGSPTGDESEIRQVISYGNYLYASINVPNIDLVNAGIMKMNKDGNVLWSYRLDGVGGMAPPEIAVDYTGNLYSLCEPNSNYRFILKFDQSGNQVWGSESNLPNNMYGQAMKIDSEGNIYVVGSTNHRGASRYDPFILKFNSSGNIIWKRLYFDGLNKYASGGDWAQNFVFDAEGNLYVTGSKTKYNVTSYKMPFLMKVDKTSGGILWQKQWGGTLPNGSHDNGYPQIVKDSEGNIIVTATMWSSYYEDNDATSIVKFKTDGTLVRQKFLDGPEPNYSPTEIFAIATDNYGNFYYVDTPTTNITLVALDRNLNMIFQKNSSSTNAKALSVTVDSSLNIYVTGGIMPPVFSSVNDGYIYKLPTPTTNYASIFYMSYDSCSFTYKISLSWVSTLPWTFFPVDNNPYDPALTGAFSIGSLTLNGLP